MAHFLDTLVGQKFDDDLLFADLIPELGRAECIIADNVFEYFFDQSGYVDVNQIPPPGEPNSISRLTGLLNISDLASAFPTIVPPFEATFVASKGYFRKLGKSSGGVLFVRRPILETQHESFSQYLSQDTQFTSRLELHNQGVRWLVYALPFVQTRSFLSPYVGAIIPITEDGRWFRGRADQPNDLCIARDEQAYEKWTRGKKISLPEGYSLIAYPTMLMHIWVMPALLTLSFIHCRNVEIIEHDPTPTRQLRRQSERRQEKTGFPLIRFRTVQIEPIKRVLHEEGRISEVGLAQALHICRGHFKDYREGEGLFGKHHDVYWWNDHRRGTIEQGAILKDYRAPLDTRE